MLSAKCEYDRDVINKCPEFYDLKAAKYTSFYEL